MSTNTDAVALTDEQIRKSMTPEQIRLERKLTCEAIDGAIAFGYQNTNAPPGDDHWLAPFWKIGRKQAELEAQYDNNAIAKALGACDWSDSPIGNKAIICRAIDALSTAAQVQAERYEWLRRRAVMVDYSDETVTKLTLLKDEGPTGEFLDDWIDGERAAPSTDDQS